jgi:hypothetical protein
MGWRGFLVGVLLLAAGIALGASAVHLWPGGRPTADTEGLPARMLEATVYLPLRDNQGHEFPPGEWQAAIDGLVKHMGGATLGDKRQGFWLTDGTVQREPVQLLTVSLERRRLGAFRQAVEELGRRLGQKSVYVRWEEPRVELIDIPTAPPEKGR